jgi:hypothetical protein
MLIPALGGLWFLGFGLLGILILALWITGIVDVTRRPDLDRRQRSAWILIIVLLPVIGSLVYFVTRPTLPDERDRILAAQSRRR